MLFIILILLVPTAEDCVSDCCKHVVAALRLVFNRSAMLSRVFGGQEVRPRNYIEI